MTSLSSLWGEDPFGSGLVCGTKNPCVPGDGRSVWDICMATLGNDPSLHHKRSTLEGITYTGGSHRGDAVLASRYSVTKERRPVFP